MGPLAPRACCARCTTGRRAAAARGGDAAQGGVGRPQGRGGRGRRGGGWACGSPSRPREGLPGRLKVYADAECFDEQLLLSIDFGAVREVRARRATSTTTSASTLSAAPRRRAAATTATAATAAWRRRGEGRGGGVTRFRPTDRHDMAAWLGVLQGTCTASPRGGGGATGGGEAQLQGWLEKRASRCSAGSAAAGGGAASSSRCVWSRASRRPSATGSWRGLAPGRAAGRRVAEHRLHYFRSEAQAADVERAAKMLSSVKEVRADAAALPPAAAILSPSAAAHRYVAARRTAKTIPATISSCTRRGASGGCARRRSTTEWAGWRRCRCHRTGGQADGGEPERRAPHAAHRRLSRAEESGGVGRARAGVRW